MRPLSLGARGAGIGRSLRDRDRADCGRNGAERGVVAEGPVGSRWAGRLRIFRYEVRCWRGGIIPDVDEAVESPGG